ncbi:MAG: hypothetical protein EGR71_04150 [Clostridiales bacterium]|nr:hypothetical protein [Clostridiales bacterium]
MAYRKFIQYLTCMGLSATLAFSEPMMIFADNNAPDTVYTEAAANVTSVSSDDKADENNFYEVPTTKVPSDLKDGTYTVPFRLFNASNYKGETQPYGNPERGELSMGDTTFAGYQAFKANTATVTVKNGKAYLTLKWGSAIGCYRFNWFDNKADYEKRVNQRGDWPENGKTILDDATGVHTEANADGASYVYIPDMYNAYGNITVNSITEMTFPLPSDNPIVWVELNAAGMLGQAQVAYLALYWDDYTVVSIDEPETPDTPEEKSYTVNLADTKNGTVTVDKGEAKAGETVKITTTPQDGYVTSEITVKNGETNVVVTKQTDGSYTFVMPEGNVTVTGTFTENTQPDNPDTPDNPEIKDELVKKFYTLKNWVYSMNPDQYYIKNNIWREAAGSIISSAINKNYDSIRTWIINQERIIGLNDNTIPEADREQFEADLNKWDAMLANPKLFGEIYNLANENSKIARGRTYEVPIKLYKTTTEDEEVTTPLGNKVNVTGISSEESNLLKDMNITTAKVTVSYNKDSGEDIIDIKFNYGKYIDEEQTKRHTFSLSQWNNNFKIVSTDDDPTKQTEIKVKAAYKNYYLEYRYAEKNGRRWKTLETTPVVLSIDWDNAKDITEGEVEVNKSILKGYVGSINNRVKRNAIGGDMVAAYPKSVTQKIIDNGLIDKAQAVLDDANATQAQVAAMEGALEQAYYYEKTTVQEAKDFKTRTAEKSAEDYTKASYDILKKYTELMDNFNNLNWMRYGAPDGEVIKGVTDENGNQLVSFTEEERKIIALKGVDGEPYSTDPADGDSVAGSYLMGMFTGGSGPLNSGIYERYIELENALVSVKEIKQDISTLKDKYNDSNKASYTSDSFNTLLNAISEAEKVVEKEDATKEEVSNARSAMAQAEAALISVESINKAVNDAAQYEDKEDVYTPSSYQRFVTAYNNSKAILAKADATKQEIEDAENELQAAIDGLKKKADKSVLNEVISEAEKLINESGNDYTEASLKIYKEAVDSAKETAARENISQTQVDEATATLRAAKNSLIKKTSDVLDKNNLADGVYTVSVNLWHATQDKESMGNAALYHTATLTVKDGKYTLRISGHKMTTSGQTGELDALRIVADGTEPKGDGSNYKELSIKKDGSDCYIDIELENTKDVTEYYYAGIKVHTVDENGNVAYPMGQNWVNNRLRISWDSLALKESADEYPAFSATDSATGIKVEAKEGALPKGTKLRVTKLTDQSTLDSINNALASLAAKNTPYKITLYIEKDGEEIAVEPKNGMELSVSLPVPEDYNTSKLICFYMDENNYANALTGNLEGNTYTINNSKIGIYTIAEKKGRDVTYTIRRNTTDENGNAGSTGSKSSTSVKTGDRTNVAAILMAMMTALAGVTGVTVSKRKKKSENEELND